MSGFKRLFDLYHVHFTARDHGTYQTVVLCTETFHTTLQCIGEEGVSITNATNWNKNRTHHDTKMLKYSCVVAIFV